MNIIQKGLIIGPQDVLDILPSRAFKIADFGSNKSPKTFSVMKDKLREKGADAELIFDAAHGKRYILFIYRNGLERNRCWNYYLTPEFLNER